jgi:hypothetical protein
MGLQKEHVIHVLSSMTLVERSNKRYVTETQKVAELQYPAVTQSLQKLFKDTQLTVEQLSFVAGHKLVSVSV